MSLEIGIESHAFDILQSDATGNAADIGLHRHDRDRAGVDSRPREKPFKLQLTNGCLLHNWRHSINRNLATHPS